MPTYNQTLQDHNKDLETLNNKITSLPIQKTPQEKIVTPSTEEQIITPDNETKTLSKVTVEAIPKGNVDTSDSNALAEEIFQDKTAYVKEKKIIGTFTITNELKDQNNNINNIITNLQQKTQNPAPKIEQEKIVTPSTSIQEILPSDNNHLFSKITVEPETKLLERFASSYENLALHYIGPNGAYGWQTLKSFIAPNVTKVDYQGFTKCEILSELKLSENLEFLGTGAFQDCSNLITFNTGNQLDSLKNSHNSEKPTIFNFTFDHTKIQKIKSETVEVIKIGAFNSCHELEKAHFPRLTFLEEDGFRRCDKLISLYCPQLKEIGYKTFCDDVLLKELILPEISSIGVWSFLNSGLENLILPGNTISELKLRTDSHQQLVFEDPFFGTPLSFRYEGTSPGKIWVPKAMINDYKSPTLNGMVNYWEKYKNIIVAIEDNPTIQEKIKNYTSENFLQNW